MPTLGQFSYTRFASSGLTYTVWVSTDLQDWGDEPVAVTEEAGEPDEETGVQTVLVELNSLPDSDQVVHSRESRVNGFAYVQHQPHLE